MSEESPYDYLYVVEWDDSVLRPPYAVIHGIKLNSGVSGEDFEKFVAEEGFPRVAKVATRIGAVTGQYLLARTTGAPPLRLEDLDLDVTPFGARTLVTEFRVLGRWKKSKKT